MNAYIVTEGAQDKAVVEALLPADLSREVAVVAGGGGSGAVSMARTLLVRHHVPVALVLDADSLSPERVREGSLTLRELLRSVSGGTPSEVFLVVPEIEEIFFVDPHLLESVLQIKISETFAIRAEARPKEALSSLFADHPSVKSMRQLLNSLTQIDIERLRQARPVAEVVEFLRHALNATKAGAA
jgi:hypothetical protein